ncbi:MAG: Nif3-like dinuclear metal center hexameric protein [Acutalibacteraceae bacterium]|nr:Nif3-like dinuclear metal center hexameric protein [Acutalibacteraceae bacterium]
MITVKIISDYINKIAPYNTKCEWDNCGILVGDEDKEIKKIALCLDLTSETLSQAKEYKADLIITHHPIIFKAQKSFTKGNLSYELAVSGISAISAHTCFDCADGGVNDVLCEILGIKNVQGVPSAECDVPMARIGEIESTDSMDFADFVSKKLGTVCRVVDCGNTVNKVAVCGGAGMDFLSDVINSGADAYVTGDISHHQMLDAKEKGITVIAAGHFETEMPSMGRLMGMIKKAFPSIELTVLRQSNPVKFIG